MHKKGKFEVKLWNK